MVKVDNMPVGCTLKGTGPNPLACLNLLQEFLGALLWSKDHHPYTPEN